MWSVPFVRQLNSGEKVALVLMDTQVRLSALKLRSVMAFSQGAWDSKMTKEQSATVFGLTAVLSSKQIYNTSKQIQEDKVSLDKRRKRGRRGMWWRSGGKSSFFYGSGIGCIACIGR